jgi:DNA (cytosine-5)-methyltransferase 1
MTDTRPTFLSLFAGIGGLDLGLERAGFRCVGQVEIDPFCRRVLAKHWPDVWRHDDVRTLTGEVVRERCGHVDLVCGGFPCQDISKAGRRAGLDGAHSGLWSDYARIVRDVRPRYVVVENVPSLLVRGLDAVLGDLAELGFDAEWGVLAAAEFGAPHIRERTFVIAHPRRERDGVSAEEVRAGWDVTQHGPWWSGEPGVRRVDDGVPARVDRIRTLGNAVVPQVAEWLGRRLMEATHEMGEILRTAAAGATDRSAGGDGVVDSADGAEPRPSVGMGERPAAAVMLADEQPTKGVLFGIGGAA